MSDEGATYSITRCSFRAYTGKWNPDTWEWDRCKRKKITELRYILAVFRSYKVCILRLTTRCTQRLKDHRKS